MNKLILFLLLFPTLVFGSDKDYYHTKINDADVYIMSLKSFERDSNILIYDSKMAEEYNKKLFPTGKYFTNTNIVIIKKGKNNILIDTGYPDTVKSLENALKIAGLKFTDITHIIYSHIHFDHIGGMLLNGKPTFPNAILYINEDEYDYFFNKAKDKSAETAKTILAPYKDKIKLFTKGIINNEFKEITAVPAYGHTPGHSLISIKDKNTDIIFVSDIFHAYELQMKYPKTAVIYDVDKKQAIKTRLDLLKKYTDSSTLIVGSHTPFYNPVTWK